MTFQRSVVGIEAKVQTNNEKIEEAINKVLSARAHFSCMLAKSSIQEKFKVFGVENVREFARSRNTDSAKREEEGDGGALRSTRGRGEGWDHLSLATELLESKEFFRKYGNSNYAKF